jgi:hypothetical protein
VALSFGAGIRRMLNESYQRAKDRYGIVTSLLVPAKPSEVETKPSDKAKADVGDAVKVIVGFGTRGRHVTRRLRMTTPTRIWQ